MKSFIYLVHAAGTDRYKIGYTAQDPKKRLQNMQTGSPHTLKILAWRKGDQADERSLHAKLYKYHTHGEWFEFPSRSLKTLYRHFPTIRPIPALKKERRIYNKDEIAREIATQVIAYTMSMRVSETRRQFADVGVSNFWYMVADFLKITDRKPILTEAQKIEIYRIHTVADRMAAEDASLHGQAQ